jgi:hypothetical protein
MMQNASHAERSSGFTLIEVLLAIGLCMFLTFVMSGALDLYWRLSTAGRDGVEQAQAARAALDGIARWIRPAAWSAPKKRPPGVSPITEETARSYPAIRIRSPYRVEFVTGSEPGVYGDSNVLVLCRDALPLDEADIAATEADVPGVRGLRFRYFDGSRWLDGWNSSLQQAVPRAVEVTMVLEGVSSGETYRTVVALPLAERGNTQSGPLSGRGSG